VTPLFNPPRYISSTGGLHVGIYYQDSSAGFTTFPILTDTEMHPFAWEFDLRSANRGSVVYSAGRHNMIESLNFDERDGWLVFVERALLRNHRLRAAQIVVVQLV
jgi:hypothetical protein